MKKIFTTLFATAAVFCASAAVPTYTVNPESGSTIEDRAEFKVSFTFSEEVKADSAQLVGGARFNSQMVTVATTKKAGNIIEVTVPADAWGTPSEGEYLLEVVLPEVYDSKGTLIQESDTDEETHETFYYPYTPRTNYVSPDNTPVEYIGYDPTNKEVTAWEAYNDGWGAINLYFTGTVDYSNMSVRVIYTTTTGNIVNVVPDYDIWDDWNMWTGDYTVSFALPIVDSLTQENLNSISIAVSGIKANDSTIAISPIVYTKSISSQFNVKRNNTAGISNIAISEGNDAIYDLNGNNVGNNVSSLEKGIYILNGKKFIVK